MNCIGSSSASDSDKCVQMKPSYFWTNPKTRVECLSLLDGYLSSRPSDEKVTYHIIMDNLGPTGFLQESKSLETGV